MRRYQESERCGKLGYEDEFLHYLEKLVRDLDRRIERGRERLQKSVSAKQKVYSSVRAHVRVSVYV